MKNVDNGIFDRVIVNNDPDFTENVSSDISANYVILCVENSNSDVRPMYETPICGLSLAEWVAMACEKKPVYITIGENENFVHLIKPYITPDTEYTVVLYANTPLVSKTHLKDLLEYVSIKRLNVCKLKKGFILKNDYIIDVDGIYSNLVYDLASNDFFEVNTLLDLDKIKGTLENRMYNFHKKNGVFIANQDRTVIDANVKIGANSKISSGVSLLNSSILAKNVTVLDNAVIINSRIDDGAYIGSGAIIENSIIKSGSVIGNKSMVSGSVIGANVKIGLDAKIVSTAVKDGSFVDNFACLENVSVSEDSKVGKACVIIGDGLTIVLDANSETEAGSKIVKKG